MLAGVSVVALSYLIGSIPVAWLAGRAAKGVDIRRLGSGNMGASNVWQSVSKTLVVPVGVAQIAQGAAGVLIARAAGQGDAVQAATAVAALLANNWNPWLRFSGGRGVGQAMGVLLSLAPVALVLFIFVALAGVALRAVPQFVALGLTLSPFAAMVAGQPLWVSAGCAGIVIIVIVKRLLADGAPDPALPRPSVWLYRLLYDRDVRDREAWVRRGLDRSVQASACGDDAGDGRVDRA